MKIIDFENIKRISESMDPIEYYGWVEFALKNKADFILPPKSRISQKAGDYYNIMPVLYEKENIACVKMIGRHSIKQKESRSVMMGDILLYEADTGILKALMDAEFITTLRTGVVAAHSALLFARKNFSTIGLIGLGNIMTVCYQTIIKKIRESGDNRKLTIKLYKHHKQEKRFISRFSDYANIEYVLCDTYEEVMLDSDIIISAVTQRETDFANDSVYKEGVTIVPICTMGFQNCDLFFDKVFTDEIEQIKGFKYFDRFNSLANVSDVINGLVPGRETEEERILVYDYGIGIHDLFFAMKFYELAERNEVEYRYCKEKYFM